LPKRSCTACTDSTGWRMPLLVSEGKILLEMLETECEIRTGRQGWCSGQRRTSSRAARRCSKDFNK
jgi:hypothetical protein